MSWKYLSRNAQKSQLQQRSALIRPSNSRWISRKKYVFKQKTLASSAYEKVQNSSITYSTYIRFIYQINNCNFFIYAARGIFRFAKKKKKNLAMRRKKRAKYMAHTIDGIINLCNFLLNSLAEP